MSAWIATWTMPAEGRRSLRVLAGLAALWVLNALDLVLTQEAAARGTFVEANLLVASWVQVAGLLALYKIGLVALGTTVLLRLRHRREAETACWLLVGIYAGVLLVWTRYYDYLEICLSDPATVRPPLVF